MRYMLINCEYCNKEYYIRPSHFKRKKHHFCSRDCYGKWESGANNPSWKDNYIRCPICGEEFKPKDKNTKYCSRKCMGLADHLKNSIDARCIVCGKRFRHIKATPPITCSKECANILHSLRMSGKGNPSYIGITQKGYKDFNKKLKEQIKKRDNYVCQLCGLPDEENFCGNGYGLSVHHIDYDKTNCNPNNLISLCNHCHAKTNYNRERWKRILSQKLKK